MNKKITIAVIVAMVSLAIWYAQKSKSAPGTRPDNQSTPDEPALIERVRAPADEVSLPSPNARVRSEQLQLAVKRLQAARSPEKLPENEQISTFDNSPDQRVWRSTWSTERQDDTWTKRMKAEVNDKARTLLAGNVDIRELSCRETVCRMYLQFEDKIDAENFTSAKHDPDLQYEYQLLNPDRSGERPREKKYNYEVLIKRPRPKHLEQTIRPADREPESSATIVATESEG